MEKGDNQKIAEQLDQISRRLSEHNELQDEISNSLRWIKYVMLAIAGMLAGFFMTHPP